MDLDTMPTDPLRPAAPRMAETLTPDAIRKLRPLGLNRSNSHRMVHLSRRGKLTAHDIPRWLVVKVLQYGEATA